MGAHLFLALICLFAGSHAQKVWNTLHGSRPLVLGHRGDPFYMPEESTAAYILAMELGADTIEPDLQMSQDGQIWACHNAYLSATTDIADFPEYADRRKEVTIPEGPVIGPRSDWWFEDFTEAELKRLRLKQYVTQPWIRNQFFNGLFPLITLSEFISLAQDYARNFTRTVNIIPEIKSSSHYSRVNVALGRPATFFEDEVLRTLEQFGYVNGRSQYGMATIQSFEVDNLKYLRSQNAEIPLLQLVDISRRNQLTEAGLDEVMQYATIVGAAQDYYIANATIVRTIHQRGMQASSYTARNSREDRVVNRTYGGDFQKLFEYLYDLGVDQVFAEKLDEAMSARRRVEEAVSCTPCNNGPSENDVFSWKLATILLAISLGLVVIYVCKIDADNRKRVSSQTLTSEEEGSPTTGYSSLHIHQPSTRDN